MDGVINIVHWVLAKDTAQKFYALTYLSNRTCMKLHVVPLPKLVLMMYAFYINCDSCV